MKRRVLLVLAVLITAGASTGWAQAVNGGIKAGVNIATLSGAIDPGVEKGNRTGFIGGLFLTAPLFPLFALQPEFLYSQQGLTATASGQEFTSKIDEFLISLFLRIGKKRTEGGGVYALIGPTFGFILSAKSDPGDQDFKDQLKGGDTGLTGGAGISIGRFLLEGRYTSGFNDLNKNNFGREKNKSRVFSAMTGLQW